MAQTSSQRLHSASINNWRCHPLVRHVGTTTAKHAHHAEHIGFVVYPAIEVFNLGHSFLYLAAIWLFATGLVVELVRQPSIKEPSNV